MYPGLGVMLDALGAGGRHNHEIYMSIKDKVITKAELNKDDDSFQLTFDDGTAIAIQDDGQSCCEHRYMTTDDDINYLVGSRLVEIRLEDGPVVEGEDEAHEQQFVKVVTDKSTVTIVTHNEHNGYYGGFALNLKRINS